MYFLTLKLLMYLFAYLNSIYYNLTRLLIIFNFNLLSI